MAAAQAVLQFGHLGVKRVIDLTAGSAVSSPRVLPPLVCHSVDSIPESDNDVGQFTLSLVSRPL